MKKIYKIDNMDYLNLLFYYSTFEKINKDEIKLITYKNKAIIVPSEAKIISYNNHLPHIKINTVEYKYCPKCKRWLSLFAFIKNKFTPDRLKNICCECDNKQRRERYAKTRAVT